MFKIVIAVVLVISAVALATMRYLQMLDDAAATIQ